jgi:alpha-galactosidase
MLFANLAFLCAVLLLITSAAYPESLDVLKGDQAPENAIWVDSLKIDRGYNDAMYKPRSGLSTKGNPITINGHVFKHGYGTRAHSLVAINLNGAAEKLVSAVGIDDEVTSGSVVFEVHVDGKKVVDSGIMRRGEGPKIIAADLRGAKKLWLIVTDAADGNLTDNADWGGTLIYLKPGTDAGLIDTAKVELEGEDLPIASTDLNQLGIHGPRIIGATPGKPFLFLIPATGKKPLKYAARNLPKGLTLDENTGIISGALAEPGETVVTLEVSNLDGSVSRKLKIVGGENKLALTPPLGWNSWNSWCCEIDDAKVRAAADAMVSSGLASFGYSYINIDDCWQGKRDANGYIQPNEKFPDMKALADYVHSKGLKIGLYSSPGPLTCAKYEGSYGHEQQDAQTWAEWGFDFVKYDWCSYKYIVKNISPTKEVSMLPNAYPKEIYMLPYAYMSEFIKAQKRDIVYSLCQYGFGNVWEWGQHVGANMWRTAGDIKDLWWRMADLGFRQADYAEYAGPGHWNDPDILCVGKVGWGKLRPTRLTHNEQITHITLWSIIPAPLLIGCDMSDMTKFTVDLLTNEEVLDVNQDPLGIAARRIARGNDWEIWARPLWDGTYAAAIFNKSSLQKELTLNWKDFGTKGKQKVRDLWIKQDIGEYEESITVRVPAHGCKFYKIGTPNRFDW